ncbi:MAG: hypothetical protein V7K21_04700 [Nostoc sp.]
MVFYSAHSLDNATKHQGVFADIWALLDPFPSNASSEASRLVGE